jgi:hypothetical protein
MSCSVNSAVIVIAHHEQARVLHQDIEILLVTVAAGIQLSSIEASHVYSHVTFTLRHHRIGPLKKTSRAMRQLSPAETTSHMIVLSAKLPDSSDNQQHTILSPRPRSGKDVNSRVSRGLKHIHQ